MYLHLIPVPVFIAIASILAYFRHKNDLSKIAIFQPAATSLLILIVALSFIYPSNNRMFTIFILIGLIFSLAGDFFLINRYNDKMFLVAIGMWFFTILFYSIAIINTDGFRKLDLVVGGILLLLFAIGVLFMIPGIKKMPMRIAIILYGINFGLLICKSFSTIFSEKFLFIQSIIILCGAILIFTGDFMLATHKFKGNLSPTFISPIYFTGQLLVAISPTFFLTSSS
jgi:uncharacterized membrane protein YhhN